MTKIFFMDEKQSSPYEYLATYVDDILIWSKDPMAVIGKYLLVKELRHPRVIIRRKCEIPYTSLEESGIRIS
jgi:hypothetical protein